MRRSRRVGQLTASVCVGLSALSAAACSTTVLDSTTRLAVTPATSRADQAVTVHVEGVAAGASGTLTVSAADRSGATWSAQSLVVVGAGGAISFASAPVADPTETPMPVGPRHGDDPTLLVSAMQPPAGSSSTGFFWPAGGARLTWTLTGTDGSSAATTTLRELTPPGTRYQALSLAQDGLVGSYDAVPDGSRHPAVLVLGGSEGGLQSLVAAAFAARGVPALAEAYFKATGLPDQLTGIPLETFDEGLAWLAAQPEVDPSRIWVVGASRGSEAALLTATRRPDAVHGVVALSPSNVVNTSYPANGRSAWTLAGVDVPFTDMRNNPSPTDVPAAVIPVERVKGPVVAVCGGSDTVWKSCAYSQAIMSRLDGAGFTPPHEVFAYPGAGHHVDILLPYQPASASSFADGVSPQQDELARDDVWPKVLTAITTQ